MTGAIIRWYFTLERLIRVHVHIPANDRRDRSAACMKPVPWNPDTRLRGNASIRFLASIGIMAAICHASSRAEEPAVFAEGSAWETVGEGYNVIEGVAAKDGVIYFTDVPDSELYRLTPGKPEFLLDKATSKANGLAFGPDGILYAACMEEPRITGWNLESGKRIEIPLPSPANDLAINANGHLYCTWSALSAVYHLNLAKPEPVKAAEMPNPNGITLNRDGTELWVGEFRGDTVRAFPILADGALGPPRPAFKVQVPVDGKGLIDGMTPLADGRLLVATALGLQIVSATAPPILIPNPTQQRANYVRITTDSAGKRWMYAAHVKTLLRRLTTLEPGSGKSTP